MGAFAVLAMLSGLLMSFTFDTDDEASDVADTDTPADPDTPEAELDTGADFVQTADGVEIDVGDDETGTIAVVYYTDPEDNAEGRNDANEARFYLVPEGVDWSSASWETQYEVPGADTYDGSPYDYQLAEFEAEFGLELLGVVDLNDTPDDADNQVGEITSNVPVEEYYLLAQTDGDELLSFLPADYEVTNDDVSEVSVLTDTTGTDARDWLSADADGITVDGAGGNDTLDTDHSNVTLIGGQGNDTINATGANVVVEAGDGNDQIFAYGDASTVDGGAGNDRIEIGSGTATGGEGDDILLASHTDGRTVSLYGEAGDDNINISGDGSLAYGGQGADTIYVGTGAIGHGGDGNDEFLVASGATAFGDDGDDLFTVKNQFIHEDGAAVLTGGAGADTFEVYVKDADNGEADDVFMAITDFDPDEDVLKVAPYWTDTVVDRIEIIEADDGSYTDVRVIYAYTDADEDADDLITALIRLQGTTGVTADEIVIMS